MKSMGIVYIIAGIVAILGALIMVYFLITFSQAIKDEANALKKDPLTMLNFVRNEVKYLPYYGSKKGSDATLVELAGNDLDKASLENERNAVVLTTNDGRTVTFVQVAGLIARRILKEVRERLTFLVNVGLDYLSLDRTAGTLSGGEGQRIRLATQIGSSLVGVLYILDEPSIGLHQRDTRRLLQTLKALRDLGNTVVVVEHDEETIRRADHVVDLGPGAGAGAGSTCRPTPSSDSGIGWPGPPAPGALGRPSPRSCTRCNGRPPRWRRLSPTASQARPG